MTLCSRLALSVCPLGSFLASADSFAGSWHAASQADSESLKSEPAETSSFPHHPDRVVRALTGDWDFAFDADYDVATRSDLPFSFDSHQHVPGAWDAMWGTGLQYSRGTGAYRQRMHVAPDQPSGLLFKACSMFCRVYVDGVLLKSHASGGYTPFWVDVPRSVKSEREVIVVASNVFSNIFTGGDLTPTHFQTYDFYQYGGLIREVSLHTFPASAPHIRHIEVVPRARSDGAPDGTVDVKVSLLSPNGTTLAKGTSVNCSLTWSGDVGATSLVRRRVDASGAVFLQSLRVGGPCPSAGVCPQPAIWDPSPEATRPLPLHTLKVSVMDPRAGQSADSEEVRFGLRTVARRGRDIFVNGKPVKLKGFNRHDMLPNQGPVLTLDQYRRDLDIIQGLNANFIRGSHYTQDDRFLDLCDELGIFVWSEGLGWGNDADMMHRSSFMRAQLETVDAMLDSNFNHPSIILWGFFNEGLSDDPATEDAYATMSAAFRARDTSRLLTWGTNRLHEDLSLKYADVISFNDYPGWYGGDYTTIEKTWLEHAAWVASNFPESPFIISEAGAGGIIGNHSDSVPPARWSLEYQALALGITARTAMTSPDIAGISIWQFQDVKVDAKNTSEGRPGGINNKGVIDRYRHLKPAATEVAAAYAAQPPGRGMTLV